MLIIQHITILCTVLFTCMHPQAHLHPLDVPGVAGHALPQDAPQSHLPVVGPVQSDRAARLPPSPLAQSLHLDVWLPAG